MMIYLHRMSEVRGWTHDDMMRMKWRVLLRYYGYWYQDRLRELDEIERERFKQKQATEQGTRTPNWKPI